MLFSCFCLGIKPAVAEPNPTINYQGKLTDSSGLSVPNGTYNMRFYLYNATGGATTSALWTEVLTGSNKVQVTNGLFSVMLGSTTPLTSVNFNQTLYLGVEIGGSGSPAWDGEMSPRKILGTVPAAFEAFKLGGVASSSFLRSDATDTASGLLTFTGGFISSASSSITNLLFGTATGTRIAINGEAFTDLTGTGLQNTSGVLSVATSSLGLGDGTFTGLSDTQNSLTANRIIFTNSGGTALTDSASLIFNGTALGIGTTDTSRLLNIAGAANAGARYTDTTNTVQLDTRAEDSQGFMGTFSNHDLRLITNNTSRLTITTAGRVGVGTTSPLSILSIQGTGTTNPFLVASSTGSPLLNVDKRGVLTLGSGGTASLFINGGGSTVSPATGSTYNTVIGNDAFNYITTTATHNIAIGYQALYGNSGTPMTGDYNVAVGNYAGSANTTGSSNSFFGWDSGTANTTASNNSFFGTTAGSENITGESNSFFGALSGSTNDTGSYNSFIGRSSGLLNTTGSSNSYLGYFSGTYNETGSANVSIGYKAGEGTSANSYASSTMIGYQTGLELTTGSKNILLGYQAGDALTTGSNNIILGYDIDAPSNTGSNQLNIGNIIFGTGVDSTGTTVDANANIGIGTSSPYARLSIQGGAGQNFALAIASSTGANLLNVDKRGVLTLGSGGTASLFINGGGSTLSPANVTQSIAIGNEALTYYTTGATDNVALGYQALKGQSGTPMTGDYNVAVGSSAGASNTTGGFGTFLGTSAGASNTTGGGNAFVGYSAGVFNTTGGSNTFVGYTSGQSNTTGSLNVLLGAGSGSFNQTGGGNVALGYSAGEGTINNSYASSTMIGYQTGLALTTGSRNSFLGYQAGLAVNTGNQNILLGYRAGDALTTGSNNIILGYDIDAPSNTTSNQLNIGNIIFGTGVDSTGTTVDANALVGIGTTSPYARLSIKGGAGQNNVLAVSSSADVNLFNVNQYGKVTIGANTTNSLFINGGGSTVSPANTLTYNTAIGNQAFNSISVSTVRNVALGFQALYGSSTVLMTGSDNVALGYQSGYGNTNGYSNSFVGSYSGYDNTSGYQNAFFGTAAGANNTIGSFNSLFGYHAGYNVTVGSNNTLLGYLAGDDLTSGSNNIVIGYDIDAPSATGDNQLNIGNIIFGTGVDSTGTTVDANANIGIGTSSPYAKLAIDGSLALTGGIYDNTATRGTNGQILQTTGTGVQWVATSSLGITGGASTFTALTDTQNSLTANRLIFTNSGATSLTDSASLVFDGARFGLGTTSPLSTFTLQGTGTTNPFRIASSTGGNLLSVDTQGKLTLGFGSTTSLFINGGGSTVSPNTYNTYNTVIGNEAFNYFTSAATDNVAIGYQALYGSSTDLMTGTLNVVVGNYAGYYNTTGSNNSFFGDSAGYLNATGENNVFVGSAAGSSNTTGSYNSFVGTFVGGLNSTGSYNSFLGVNAGAYNTTGSDNSFFGYQAGFYNETGSSNVALGRYAGWGTSGSSYSNNTMIGTSAGYALTTGSQNILLGYQAGDALTSGSNNIVIGYNIDAPSATVNNQLNIGNTLFGINVNSTGTTVDTDARLGIGTSSPYARLSIQGGAGQTHALALASSTGANLLKVDKRGVLTLGSDTTASLFINGGGSTVSPATASTYNTVVGNEAFNYITISATDNVAMGYRALYGNSGTPMTGDSNVAVGNYSGQNNTTGTSNSFLGSYSGFNNTTGSRNTLIGNESGWYNQTGTANVAIGYRAGEGTTANSYASSTMIGYQTGLALTTGSKNILLGYQAGDALTTGSNNIILGYDIDAPSNTGSNQLNIGNTLFGINVNSTGTTVDTDARLGIGTSSPYARLSIQGGAGQNFALAIASSTGANLLNVDKRGVLTLGSGGTASLFINGGGSTVSPATAGTYNTVMGIEAFNYITTTATNNTAIGYNALYGQSGIPMTGDYNVAVGNYAGQNNTTGSYNSFFGTEAGSSNTTGTENVFIGRRSGLSNNTGSGVTFVGASSGLSSYGDENTFIGSYAGYGNLSGKQNSFLGSGAGFENETGSANVAIGYYAGMGTINNSYASSTMIGYQTGLSLTTGSRNLLLGYQAGDALTSGSNNIVIGYDIDAPSNTGSNQLNIGNIIFGTGVDSTGTTVDANANIGIGTSSPVARLSIQKTGVSGAGVVGIDQYLQTENSVASALQYGNYLYLNASNTSTTTIVGSMLRIKDDTTFGNTVRGLEVQTNRGVNTQGENTAISGTARTFGIRGVTTGDAGGTFEPAGGYFETRGSSSGNAIRGYSNSITSATLLSLFQSSSTFTGTGLEMNFGNTGGSFSSSTSKYLDFQNSNVSVFTVSAFGTTTIGDGSNQAGLQIGFGGICVDNDGACVASTTGRITAVENLTGNSDLAEMYFSSTDLETGDVVSLVGKLSIDRANKNNPNPVLGVVSTKPGLLLGFDDSSLTSGEAGYPIALAGRVPVKLSTENGPIKNGDQLMLSSIPGVAMKAKGVGTVIGIALEDFDESRMYSDTYINQFGDDISDVVYEPVSSNEDPRIKDGCYYSGGIDIGGDPCVPLVATTTSGQIVEVNKIIENESRTEAIAKLLRTDSDVVKLNTGETVRVGQVVMFVKTAYRWFDEDEHYNLVNLMSSSSVTIVGENEDETLFDRIVNLANKFIDGVLTILELKANRVEVTEQLCVDGVCVTGDDLRKILNNNSSQPATVNDSQNSTLNESIINQNYDNLETSVDSNGIEIETNDSQTQVEIIIPNEDDLEIEINDNPSTSENSSSIDDETINSETRDTQIEIIEKTPAPAETEVILTETLDTI